MNTATQLPVNFLQDPHAAYDLLRAEGPVRKVQFPYGLKGWLVTRYDEARAALMDPRISKNIEAIRDLFEKHAGQGAGRRDFGRELTRHMLNTDPPQHTRLRKLVNKAFTARRVEQLRPRVEEITAGLLDAMEGGELDLLDALAFPLPITVICELLGIPTRDRGPFRAWSNTLVTHSTPEAIAEASHAMAGYFTSLVEAKRAEPGEDFFSALVHADDSGDRLDCAELTSMAFLLLVAGHETTVSLIGNAVLALLRNPDQLAVLRDDPSLIAGAAEEFLRYDGSVNLATIRYTREPVELGGTTIPAGELVMVSLAAANRDPEKFPDPHRLDLTRHATGHLAFGHGIHHCLGAPLARLEFEVAIGGLLARFPKIELAREPEELVWRDSILVRGLNTLPVRLYS